MARRNRRHEETFEMEDFSEGEQLRVMHEATQYANTNAKSGWKATAWWWEKHMPALVLRLDWNGEQQNQEALRDDASPGWAAQNTGYIRSTAEAAALNRIEAHLADIKGFLETLRATSFSGLARSVPVVPGFLGPEGRETTDKTITGELVAIGAGPRDWDSL